MEGDALDQPGDFLGHGSALWDRGIHVWGFIFLWKRMAKRSQEHVREFMSHNCKEGLWTLQAVLADANADGISRKSYATVQREIIWDGDLSSNAVDTATSPICAG